MALLSLQEPLKMARLQPAYKVGVVVPIDVSSIFLDDATFVVVQTFFQNTPDSTPFPLAFVAVGPWGPLGSSGTIKKKQPNDTPTIGFTPTVPGIYFAQVLALTTGTPTWQSSPITVVP